MFLNVNKHFFFFVLPFLDGNDSCTSQKKKLGVNVTVPMKCASLYCVVQLSANGNRKHFQSQYLIFFFL